VVLALFPSPGIAGFGGRSVRFRPHPSSEPFLASDLSSREYQTSRTRFREESGPFMLKVSDWAITTLSTGRTNSGIGEYKSYLSTVTGFKLLGNTVF